MQKTAWMGARAHSQKKALTCVCVLSARRTATTRLPEGSGSPGEFPEQREAIARHAGCTMKRRVAERTAIRQRADAAVALPKKRDRLVGGEQRRGRGERLEVLPASNAIPGRQRKEPLGTHEADVAGSEGFNEAVVEGSERRVNLGRQHAQAVPSCHKLTRRLVCVSFGDFDAHIVS